MRRPASFRLEPITRRNWRAAVEVSVSADQLRFVAGSQPVALVVLAKAYVRPGGLQWEPLAVVADDAVVGVVALAHAATHTQMFHLAIDMSAQRRGIGAGAVGLLLRRVADTRPGCQEVRLTVHPDNTAAQHLYRGAGFSPTGETSDGEPVWSIRLDG